jgi:hypothetical protein
MAVTEAKRLPLKRKMIMRIVETAAVGFVALAVQMLVVATVLM